MCHKGRSLIDKPVVDQSQLLPGRNHIPIGTSALNTRRSGFFIHASAKIVSQLFLKSLNGSFSVFSKSV